MHVTWRFVTIFFLPFCFYFVYICVYFALPSFLHFACLFGGRTLFLHFGTAHTCLAFAHILHFICIFLPVALPFCLSVPRPFILHGHMHFTHLHTHFASQTACLPPHPHPYQTYPMPPQTGTTCLFVPSQHGSNNFLWWHGLTFPVPSPLTFPPSLPPSPPFFPLPSLPLFPLMEFVT